MNHCCLTCTSSGILTHGPRAGACWCHLKGKPVNPDSACPSYPEAHERMISSVRTRMDRAGLQRVLVKSAAESQFETNSSEKTARPLRDFQPVLYQDA